MEKVTQWKMAIAAFAAALTALWGWFGWAVVALVVLMMVDYVCGTVIAMGKQEWSSAAARSGIWHKCSCVLAVVVSGMADLLIGVIIPHLPITFPFEYSVLFCPMVVIWYILTEMGSILEHAVNMGGPVPAWLRKILALTRDAVNDAGEQLTEGDCDGD